MSNYNSHWSLLRDFDRQIQNAVRGAGPVSQDREWIPAVDIHEEPGRYLLSIDVPGVDPEGIEIAVDEGLLVISGRRDTGLQSDDAEFTRRERAQGGFKRSFRLPDGADIEAVTARGEHGVLQVVVPKRAETKARRIPVTH